MAPVSGHGLTAGAFGMVGALTAGALGTAGVWTAGAPVDTAGTAPPGVTLGGAGRNTKYSTSAIASTSTTLSAMISPSGIDRRVSAGTAAGVGAAGLATGGAGVADCRISIV